MQRPEKSEALETKVMKICPESLALAKELLLAGQVVAFPTETVYGLGAWAYSAEGIRRIYEAKGRPSDNPLIVHVAPGASLEGIAEEIPQRAEVLMDRFWPGPLTLIMPRDKDHIPSEVTGGLETVAIRMPSGAGARALLSFCGIPVVAPSANTSGRPSPTTALHVLEDLGGKIPLILDGGPCEVGLESTIVDLTEEKPLVLRPGGITLEMLKRWIPDIDLDPGVKGAISVDAKVVPKAPGMKYRHYAPKGHLILTNAPAERWKQWIREDLSRASEEQGKDKTTVRIGVIASNEMLEDLEQEGVLKLCHAAISLGYVKEPEMAAQLLFGALRQADEKELDIIYGEAFSREGVGEAIMNRFVKASAEQRIL
ncbi:MAG: threonylcarbamoyl-AMP synthase [Lachnospiraceae bacterium]|nr:threonylcarbamoyl-AMP synthase [Lachnospiraceae bacterium]